MAVDSHVSLPTVTAPLAVLHDRELAPFRAAISAGVAAVMPGHLLVARSTPAAPATVSRRIVTDLLRDELGFGGVVVTDALDMGGIGGPGAIPGNVVRALAAGADLCCLGPGNDEALVEECIDVVVAAVAAGELAAERVAEAAGRTRGWRDRGNRGRMAPHRRRICHRATAAVLARVGEAAAAGRCADGPVPPQSSGAHVVELDRPANIAAGPVPWGVATALAELDPTTTATRVVDGADRMVDTALAAARHRPGRRGPRSGPLPGPGRRARRTARRPARRRRGRHGLAVRPARRRGHRRRAHHHPRGVARSGRAVARLLAGLPVTVPAPSPRPQEGSPVADIAIRGVTKRYDGRTPAVGAVDLDIADGELLVLVGPSGCGKSTLLRMIAGLEEVTEGTIAIGGDDVTHRQPKDRDIAMVFQSYALYPHMSVARNIGYPLKLAKAPRAEVARRVAEVADVLQLTEVLGRTPAQLSGGQRQRVAMGRAIIRQPRAFLLDEPLSNLDAKLRVEMRAEIARLQRELAVTTVYVTHDQTEAMTMGTRVAVLKDGRLQQVETPSVCTTNRSTCSWPRSSDRPP